MARTNELEKHANELAVAANLGKTIAELTVGLPGHTVTRLVAAIQGDWGRIHGFDVEPHGKYIRADKLRLVVRTHENEPSPVLVAPRVAPKAEPKATPASEPVSGKVASEMQAYLVPKGVDFGYISRKITGQMNDIELLERAYKAKTWVMLSGKPGCGKSTAPYVLAQKLGVPIVRLSMSEATDESKILGTWKSDGNGGFIYQEAPALKAFRYGGILLVDEVNAATPNNAFVLHPFLDTLGRLFVEDLGLAIERHPDFFAVGTMNPTEDSGAVGTNAVNYALWDRFDCKLVYDYDTGIESKLVKGCEPILELRDKIRKAQGLTTELTTRMVKALWHNAKVFGPDVALLMFTAAFGTTERPVIEEAIKILNTRRKLAEWDGIKGA